MIVFWPQRLALFELLAIYSTLAFFYKRPSQVELNKPSLTYKLDNFLKRIPTLPIFKFVQCISLTYWSDCLIIKTHIRTLSNFDIINQSISIDGSINLLRTDRAKSSVYTDWPILRLAFNCLLLPLPLLFSYAVFPLCSLALLLFAERLVQFQLAQSWKCNMI